MEIDDDVLKSFRMGKIFKPNDDEDGLINSLSFHRTYDLLVTASDDDAIRVYDTNTAKKQQQVYSKKYGVSNICFAHDPNTVIYSSVKGSHAWRYHDLNKNVYIRYFEGHTGKVTTLCHSPKTDEVLSAAEDKQVRLWDIRNGQCTALLQAPGLPTVAWDEQGLVFCVGTESGVVKLYDARNYSSGPFNTFVVEQERNSNALFASLRFSLDGQFLLAVVEGRIYVLDAFSGKTLQQVSTGVPEGGAALEACLTANGRYILSGCGDRHVRAWSVAKGEVVAQWKQHADVPTCLKFSPKKMLVASACRAVVLWIPDLNALPPEKRPRGGVGGVVQPMRQQWPISV